MSNNIAHFAIHAEDCERAKRFYQAVFGWEFEPWGPPEFWRIHTGPDGIHGALQKRREPVTGTGVNGYECTIAVADVHSIVTEIETHGGKIMTPPFTIDNVGTVVMFQDTEGNVVGAMQYVEGVVKD